MDQLDYKRRQRKKSAQERNRRGQVDRALHKRITTVKERCAYLKLDKDQTLIELIKQGLVKDKRLPREEFRLFDPSNYQQ